MSIYKFSTSPTFNLTNFKNWLDTVKQNTFLNDCTITLSVISDYNSTVTIAKNGVSVIINAIGGYEDTYNILTYIGNSTRRYTSTRTSEYMANNGIKLSGAILSTTGIIIKLTCATTANTTRDRYICITLDNDNNLAVVYPTGNGNVNADITGYNTVVKDSIDTNSVTLTPRFDGSVTAIGSCVPNSTTNKILPNAYVSLTTQLSSYGLYALSFGDDVFISSGYFLIKED